MRIFTPRYDSPATAPEKGLDNPQVYGIVVASFNKSVKPKEELKVEQIFSQVLSTTDTTLRMLDVRFT